MKTSSYFVSIFSIETIVFVEFAGYISPLKEISKTVMGYSRDSGF